MPIEHVVEGPFKVSFAAASSIHVIDTTPTELCYNVGNTPIIQEDREINIPSDLYGSEEGIPADVQLLGAVIAVPIESRHYDRNACMSLQTKLAEPEGGGAEGLFPSYNQFVKQNAHYGELVLTSQQAAGQTPQNKRVYTFHCARPINFSPMIGLASNTFRCVFQCLPINSFGSAIGAVGSPVANFKIYTVTIS
jgi:hypothetical protein